MAAQMIAVHQAAARKSTNEDGTPIPIPQPKKLSYHYFTAGSGGAGPTILSTSFLLCGEQVTAYKDGAAVTLPPASYRQVGGGYICVQHYPTHPRLHAHAHVFTHVSYIALGKVYFAFTF
jgi:hypothetical protein